MPFKEVQKILSEEFGGVSKDVGIILRRLGYSRNDDITKESFCHWFRFFSPLNLTVIENQPKIKKRTSSASLKTKEAFSKLPTETADITALGEVNRENTLQYVSTLMNQSWFLSYFDNVTICSILEKEKAGTFAVRYSVNYDRSFVVSYKLDGDGVNHLLISGNEVGFTLPGKNLVFPNIYKAIADLMKNPVQGLVLQPFVGIDKQIDKITFFGP